MAGWLAWNLRIITVTAVACFSYYGADYWSSRNKHESIEKTDFEEFQELDEVKSTKLGSENPSMADGYLSKIGINNAIGGSTRGSSNWITKMKEECKTSPYSLINGNDLRKRRFCRLYWSVGDSIDILIKTENKQVLLSSEAKEWTEKWQEYQKGSKPWGQVTTLSNGVVPQEFKDRCEKEAKELVHNEDDDKYKLVTNYCTRDKTIKDEIDKDGIKLLEREGNNGEWQKKLETYNSTIYGAKFESNKKINNISELQQKCEETVAFKMTVQGRKELTEAVRIYCSYKS